MIRLREKETERVTEIEKSRNREIYREGASYLEGERFRYGECRLDVASFHSDAHCNYDLISYHTTEVVKNVRQIS